MPHSEKETVEIDGMICEKIVEHEDKKKQLEFSECPSDPRFQQMNKTHWCYTMFVDFHRCSHYLGAEHEHCKYFETCYNVLCPRAWTKTWEEQIEGGIFPRDLTREMG